MPGHENLVALSNAPWVATGYGNQTALFCPRLRDAGYDVAISAFYGLSGAILSWNGMPVYPGGYHPYGQDAMLPHAAHWFGGGNPQGGVIVTLVDAWVLDPAKLATARVACWTPVDHETVPPQVARVLQESAALPVAMSQHGQGALKEQGLLGPYVPHGVDTQLFQPADREESRRVLGWPQDAFIVGMVAANKGYPPRKGFPEALAAFARFRREHSEAVLYLHTEPYGVMQGVNLSDLLRANGVPAEAVRVADPYWQTIGFPPEHMVAAYSGMDVLLNPSYGEGFGIPMLEAQACGTPVVSTNTTAMPEVGDVGWSVSGQKVWSQQGAYQMVPDVGELAKALESAFNHAPRMRARAREHALAYDADRVTEEYWLPALKIFEAPRELALHGLELVS